MATVRMSVAPENDSSNQKEWRETHIVPCCPPRTSTQRVRPARTPTSGLADPTPGPSRSSGTPFADMHGTAQPAHPPPADTLNAASAPHASGPAHHLTAAPRAPAMAQRRLRRESLLLRRYYFFSGSGLSCGAAGALLALTPPPGVNGKVANIVFAWFCICSCICTNMFFDCSI